MNERFDYDTGEWTPSGAHPTRRRAEARTTATTVSTSAAVLYTVAAYTGSIPAIVVATIGVIAAVYEWLAIRTNDFPTITEWIKGAGWTARIAFTAAATLAIADHFITGWLL